MPRAIRLLCTVAGCCLLMGGCDYLLLDYDPQFVIYGAFREAGTLEPIEGMEVILEIEEPDTNFQFKAPAYIYHTLDEALTDENGTFLISYRQRKSGESRLTLFINGRRYNPPLHENLTYNVFQITPRQLQIDVSFAQSLPDTLFIGLQNFPEDHPMAIAIPIPDSIQGRTRHLDALAIPVEADKETILCTLNFNHQRLGPLTTQKIFYGSSRELFIEAWQNRIQEFPIHLDREGDTLSLTIKER